MIISYAVMLYSFKSDYLIESLKDMIASHSDQFFKDTGF